MPPTCFGHTCGHPRGGVLQRIHYETFEPVHKCKLLSFKLYGLKRILKYKIQINFCDKLCVAIM